jgi:predicted MPP superfamily phosphohydrolase
MKNKKRKIEILVLSDVHLGTYGCHARELLRYLKSINPKTIVLNGDIIDIWQFSKRYWPKNHMKVVKQLMNWISKGKKTYYITGNHDEMLRRFAGLKMGSFKSIIVTENGAAFDDIVEDGVVNDLSRQLFLQDHITQVLRAREEGINVNGYFVWTFTDNSNGLKAIIRDSDSCTSIF